MGKLIRNLPSPPPRPSIARPLVLTALAGTVVARAAAQDRLVVMKRLGKEDSIRS